MSENYGACRVCHGDGYVLRSIPGTTEREIVELTEAQEKTVSDLCYPRYQEVLKISQRFTKSECSVCGATGMSGDAMYEAI